MEKIKVGSRQKKKSMDFNLVWYSVLAKEQSIMPTIPSETLHLPPLSLVTLWPKNLI